VTLAAKLPHLETWNAVRVRLAERYRRGLDGVVRLPPPDGVFHLFVIRTAQRDELKSALAEHGVGTDVHYPLPVHRQKPYAASVDLPQTERLAAEVLSLPIYPELDEDAVDYVIECIRRVHGA
jgi:dTDP-4-amino-4,6-dideoxygalactose transaminase